MSKRLFSVNKIGVFLDVIKHHNETRKSGEVKVITCTLRVEPYDAKLATALDDRVRVTLFKLNHPDPQPHIQRCDFILDHPRQTLDVFASSDTPKPSIRLSQVKIQRVYVRNKKAANGFVMVFDATFGPVGDKELAYVEAWRGSQRAVTFEEAEPDLEFEDQDDQDEDDEAADRPTPMFATTADSTAPVDESAEADKAEIAAENEAAEPVRQRPRSHYADRGQKKKGGRRAAAAQE